MATSRSPSVVCRTGRILASWLSAARRSMPRAPTSTGTPPGSFWRWGAMAAMPSERLVAADSDGQPCLADRPNRAARSPPAGSASTTVAIPGLGHDAASMQASVVTPGDPFKENMATVLTTGPLPAKWCWSCWLWSPKNSLGARCSPGPPRLLWPRQVRRPM